MIHCEVIVRNKKYWFAFGGMLMTPYWKSRMLSRNLKEVIAYTAMNATGNFIRILCEIYWGETEETRYLLLQTLEVALQLS